MSIEVVKVDPKATGRSVLVIVTTTSGSVYRIRCTRHEAGIVTITGPEDREGVLRVEGAALIEEVIRLGQSMDIWRKGVCITTQPVEHISLSRVEAS